MKTVSEISRITGVSVRALHHYDAIGLLRPARVTEAGYRLYDDAALSRLQSILLFRELEFPLREIKTILDSPDFDEKEALAQQRELLILRRKQIDRLIDLTSSLIEKGEKSMDFSAFDKEEIERYAEEAKQRWGDSAAYREYEGRADGNSEEKAAALMEKFAALGKLKDLPPESEEVKRVIGAIQAFITENFYICTDEIFAGLGQMYTADERFRRNIDSVGGEGTAEFAAKAIECFVKGRK